MVDGSKMKQETKGSGRLIFSCMWRSFLAVASSGMDSMVSCLRIRFRGQQRPLTERTNWRRAVFDGVSGSRISLACYFSYFLIHNFWFPVKKLAFVFVLFYLQELFMFSAIVFIHKQKCDRLPWQTSCGSIDSPTKGFV